MEGSQAPTTDPWLAMSDPSFLGVIKTIAVVAVIAEVAATRVAFSSITSLMLD